MSAEPAPSVLVTGAGVGIGYALATSFALSGSRVALNDLDPALARIAAGTLNGETRSDRVVPYGVDVADVPAVRRMVAEADERFGGLHIAIANAGLTNYGSFLDYTPEAFDRLTAVNLRGSYFTLQAAARAMLARQIKGRLLLMSSITGERAFVNLGAYGVTKAGLRHMAKSLALELGPHGITVNAISPGAIVTERTLADDPAFEQNWAGVTPAGRVGYVDDIVAAARFLTSPEASHVTGHTITVDGGWTLASPVPPEVPTLPEVSTKLK